MNEQSKNAKDSMEYDYLKPVSFQDCTGLIPSAPANDGEIENYQELYPFLPSILLPDEFDDI